MAYEILNTLTKIPINIKIAFFISILGFFTSLYFYFKGKKQQEILIGVTFICFLVFLLCILTFIQVLFA